MTEKRDREIEILQRQRRTRHREYIPTDLPELFLPIFTKLSTEQKIKAVLLYACCSFSNNETRLCCLEPEGTREQRNRIGPPAIPGIAHAVQLSVLRQRNMCVARPSTMTSQSDRSDYFKSSVVKVCIVCARSVFGDAACEGRRAGRGDKPLPSSRAGALTAADLQPYL